MGKLGVAGKKKNMRKVQKKRRMKASKPPKELVIEGIEFLNKDQLKKIKKNPTNSIRPSGKRKQKMLKRMRQSQKAASSMEVQVESKKSGTTYKKNKKKQNADDNLSGQDSEIETMDTD